MKFKEGDVVSLNKRGLIGGEKIDFTTSLLKNKIYIVTSTFGNTIRLYGYIHSMHSDHFRLHEVVNNAIQGVNYFKKGDKVRLVKRGKIGWETDDYTIFDGLLEDEIYEVRCYYTNGVSLTNNKGKLHPNHFKKIENGI